MHVLVTRPDPAGSELCEKLEEAGDAAIHLPTIEIISVNNASTINTIKQLGEQDWIIFISPQAVYSSVPTIRAHWPNFPPNVQFAAIGEGTAVALKHAGYNIHAYPKTSWNSEGLLELPVFHAVTGKKITIVKGEGGRTHLAEVLSQRGAQVLPLVAYRRAFPQVNMQPYLEQVKEKKIDVIVGASFEAIRNLKELFGIDGWPFIRSIPLIVVSERIKILAQHLGFQTIWVAKNASHTAILMCVKKRNT